MAKNQPTNAGHMRVQSLDLGDPLEKGMATHSSNLAWVSHGQRSPGGCSPQGRKESDTTEATYRYHFCFMDEKTEAKGFIYHIKHRMPGKFQLQINNE